MKLNKKILTITLGIALLVYACSDSPDGPGPPAMRVNVASSIIIDDVSNNGNATDLEISFNKALVESNIAQYRLIIVQSDKADDFDITDAELLPAERYQNIPKTGSRVTAAGDINLMDSDGLFITNDQSYVGFIMSVADDTEQTLNSLSEASNILPVGITSIKVTYAGNMGVVISDGTNQVAIDAMHGNLSGWRPIRTSDLIGLQRGNAPWESTDIVMTTHSHGDHHIASEVSTLLSAQSGSLFIGPTSSRGGIPQTSQVSTINPALGTSETVVHNGITVEVLRVTHFDLFGNDFSGVESYGFLVNIGGLKVLHLGDILYDNDNLSPFNLAAQNIDLVILPTFNALVSTANRDIILNQVAPNNIMGIHLPTSTQVSTVKAVYPEATVFTEALEFKRY